MTIDRRLNRRAREARAKLEKQEDHVRLVDDWMEEAVEHAGRFNARLAEADLHAFAVGPRVEVNVGAPYGMPYWRQPDHPAEHERRQARVREIEAERKAVETASIVTVRYDLREYQVCTLDPRSVTEERGRAVMARDQFARELAEIEAQIPRGELCELGVPAREFTEYRRGVAAARERAGVGG